MQTKPFEMEAVSPSMRALLDAVRVLKQTGKPVTSTGQDTFANQVVQAAEGQPAGPQQQPVAGQPVAGEPPSGMPAAMQMAEQAAPTQVNNAHNAQAQQLAQQAAQMLQQQQQTPQPAGGIGGLPSNIKAFKDGGVVGYAVGGGIPVGEATPAQFGYLSEDELKKLPPELQKEYYRQQLAARSAAQAKLAAGPSAAPAGPNAAAAKFGNMGILKAMSKVPLRNIPLAAVLAELFMTSDDDMAVLRKAEAERAQTATPGEYKALKPLDSESTAPDRYMAADALGKSPTFNIDSNIDPLVAARALQTAYNEEKDPRKKELIKAKIVQLVGQAEQSGGGGGGYGGGGGGGDNSPGSARTSPQRPTAAQAAAFADTITPDADLSGFRKQVQELQDFLKTRPDTAGDRAAALNKAFEEELANRPAEDQIRRWTMAADAARRGDYGGFGDAVIYNRERATKMDAMKAEGLAALQDKAFADKTGDRVKGLEAEDKLRNLQKEYDNMLADAGQTATNSMTNLYGYDTQADLRQYAADNRAAGRPRHLDIVNTITDNTQTELKEWIKNNPRLIRKDPTAIDNERKKISLREVAKYKAANHPDAAAIEETILAQFAPGANPVRIPIENLPK